MHIHSLTAFSKLMFFCVMIVALLASTLSGVSVVKAKSALDVSQLNISNDQIQSNNFAKKAITAALNPTLSISDSCGGPIIYLSGVTTLRYKNNLVADGTTFDRTAWYSDAVGNGTNVAFTVGNEDPPPQDVCVLRGVINGHIPLSWSWQEVHDFGGSGDRTYTGRLVLIDGARVHNVEDGWHPRELPEFGNTGIMQMRNTYMTGIRDDAIENDKFMPGFIEDSLFDGVFTFLSEQNESGGIPTTIGPNEDPYIRINRVYVRLYPTSSDGYNLYSGRWFKWSPSGATNHNLIITDSVFAAGPAKGRWSVLDFPAGTTFQGTNYILWLGTPGEYEATIPSGIIFLEGQAALDKWNEVRNNWLTSHGYAPRPVDDLNPMDDPVVAPELISISGNVGVAGATLNYAGGSTFADGSGNYSFSVPQAWNGTVTPSKACYSFSPVNNVYNNVLANQTAQNYIATPLNYTVNGNVGVNGATLSYFDSTLKTAVADGGGNYSITVSCGWSGTITPYKTRYTFIPVNKTYTNLQSNQSAQDYTAQVCAGCADVNVIMGGNPMGSYTLASGQERRENYLVSGGPMKVQSTNAIDLVAAIRLQSYANNTLYSFVETMGVPSGLLSSKYYFPTYNNTWAPLNSQLRFANINDTDINIKVTIGSSSWTYPVAAHAERREYLSVSGGPVIIESTDPTKKIIAAIRLQSYANNTLYSFAETMGIPLEQLSDTYYFPSYNNTWAPLNSQLRVANLNATATTVRVTIGTSVEWEDVVPGLTEKRLTFDVSSGPVIIQSLDPTKKIVAAIRLQSYANNTLYSFVETMGVPSGLLSHKYYFPSYNNLWAPLNSQLRFANLNAASTTVRVTIGNSVEWEDVVPGLTEKRLNFDVSGGPVIVESLDPAKKIVAAIRLQSYANNTLYSFAETMGIPLEQLSDTYYFPSYNNTWAPLNSQLRFGVP